MAQKVIKSAPPADVEEAEEEVTLTTEESDEFKYLLTVGRISQQFNLKGHTYTLKTLSMSEDLAVGRLIKSYIDTPSFGRAYSTAIVAAALRELDGEPLYEPLRNEDMLEVIEKRFNKMLEFAPVVVDAFYKNFLELERQLGPLVSRLGKTSD